MCVAYVRVRVFLCPPKKGKISLCWRGFHGLSIWFKNTHISKQSNDRIVQPPVVVRCCAGVVLQA
jgi:hypothetical protein